MADIRDLRIARLQQAYQRGESEPGEIIRSVYARIRDDDPAIWIHLRDEAHVLAELAALPADGAQTMPLYGIPFAIKDNIDDAGLPTTAGCPDYAYVPGQSAHVVERLRAAGAILIGKTNLDQFATGLVGTRSPYGVPANSFDADYVPGGSSSGSAVAVAKGLVSFALGTDTAGSGRVPAAFNNIVGLKPSCGRISTAGVVPACRSLDCVSIFALTVDDARAALRCAEGYDPQDPYSRNAAVPKPRPSARWRIGIPTPGQLEFFGNEHGLPLYERACAALRDQGHSIVEIDFEPFRRTAALLYEGAWVAERYAAVGEFIDAHPGQADPTVAQIIAGGRDYSARDAFAGMYALAALKTAIAPVWREIDLLLTPTAPRQYRLDAVQQAPIELNSNLGTYTNFVNLLDLCALAVPAGIQPDGLPFGVTLIAPAFEDDFLADIGSRLHPALCDSLGATGIACPPAPPAEALQDDGMTAVFVVGAHRSGLPLNSELTGRGAVLVGQRQTAPLYRMYALDHLAPARPGLVRGAGGAPILGEVWSMPTSEFGGFVAGIPGPLGIGQVALDGGESVPGFLCEAYAVENARDITSYGDWVAYTSDTTATNTTSQTAETGD